MVHARQVGTLSMPGERLTLLDEFGTAHQVSPAADGTLRVGEAAVRIHRAGDGSLLIEGARNLPAWGAVVGSTRWVFLDGRVFTFEADRPQGRRAGSAADAGPLTAPMPATVRTVTVARGDTVRRGDVLVVLEAMKMELPVRAAADGVVSAVHCREGEMVQSGQELIEVTASPGLSSRPQSQRGSNGTEADDRSGAP